MSATELFSPLALRGIVLKNRIMLSPMAQYAALDGSVTDWHFAHFAKFAAGGVGLIFTEATKVERRGLGTVGDMGLWKDEQMAPLSRIVDFIHAQGAAAGIQLNHAGRKAGTLRPWEGYGTLDRSVPIEGQQHWEVIGPSPIAYMEGWPTPREMSESDIETVIDAFAQAARRADSIGFDVLELHGAHGYLIHQFLSEACNRRSDRWGGSLENRMRFALEIAAAVRRAWPEGKPLFFRISAVDEGGWTLSDSARLCAELKKRGVDVIDCSSGGIGTRSPTAAAIKRPMGFQVSYARQIRKSVDIATAAVGLIIEPSHANAIIERGDADLVAIGRELLFNPFWAHHAAAQLAEDPDFEMMPPQYQWWLQRRSKAGYGPAA
ncbi:NADH:flavin oxidoreductase/NADH oxidase [Paracandidimonas soli]|uniref:2,4-dienoyl-CoA reductase-like NADH-dependent reductase (Old Yellow Enzyme family) n=1 Tax=Paracandidimonas soli TaxID=1917182 RepID=A0A4R3UVA2_9BURK|nr:NADH:flavin oxidoreductase/NADH oxidase [Paracandidimonas soli]TCU96076.1 2,4-dienoyl-CoA reductase-like NADH-dependent reductase (Old Yellow Enzyme family) [Paracandidimonas soli]